MASFCKTVAYYINVNHIHKRPNDSHVRNDRNPESPYDRVVMRYWVKQSAHHP